MFEQHPMSTERGEQGDQIGRRFAYWLTVYFAQFLLQ
jgi:hypothetical protein